MITAPAVLACPTPGKPFDQNIGIHLQCHNGVESLIQLNQRLLKSIGLHNSPRKSVKNKAVTAVRLLQALSHNADNNRIGHQRSGIHEAIWL